MHAGFGSANMKVRKHLDGVDISGRIILILI
jgi:hypothetical protein